MFWRIVFTSDMLFFRDIFNYSYPLARFIHDLVRQGQLPYWNPYYNWGQHVLSDPNAMFFYPSTLFIVLLPVKFAFAMHFVIHFAWAGVGTYVLARRWGQRRDAALFAALFFALSGPLLSTGNFYNHAAAAAWMPWVLVAADRVLIHRAVRAWVILALVVSVQFLAAEPVTWMASLVLAAAYLVVGAQGLAPLLGNARLLTRQAVRLLAGFALAVMAALALAAVQLFPALELLHHTRRSLGISLEEATFWSLHPLQLIEFIVPDFFGSPFPPLTKWKEVLNGINDPYLVSLYSGFIPLFLALAGWRFSRDRRSWFTLGGFSILLLFAFGRFTPVFAWFFKILPVMRLVRYPVKLVVPATLLAAISAGWGYEALRRPLEGFRARRKVLVWGGAALAAALGALWAACFLAPDAVRAAGAQLLESARASEAYAERAAYRLSPKDLTAGGEYFLQNLRLHLPGLLGLALGALLWLKGLNTETKWAGAAARAVGAGGCALVALVNYGANPTVPREFYDTAPPALRYFAPSSEPYRACFLFYLAETSGGPSRGSPARPTMEVPVVPGFPAAALPNFFERVILRKGTMLNGIETATPDEFDAAFPLQYYEFWRFARLAGMRDAARHDCLLGRANVRYLITFRPRESPAAREVAKVINPPPVPSYLYEDLCAMPRAFAARSALYSNDPLFTLGRLSDPAFPALDQVILAAPPPAAVGTGTSPAPTDSPRAEVRAGTSPAPTPGGKVEIIENTPSRVTLRATLEAPGTVVLLDRFDPNWHATLDGREATVMRADHMFRAVEAPADTHEIQFVYREKWLGTGLAVTLATALALAFLAAK
ncbi:MAG: hypothetical protein DMG21_04565 [Acidobacteria bacterium]|nr:MAG: hypothetical protein DMG21_04565 [Acidobacteriota bacterium]